MQNDLLTNPRADFWAITTYFNLTNGMRRRNNYHCFRRNISLPLLTVEWHPESSFQLAAGDADVLLQVGGGDLMWQKERLLSLALAALPAHVKYVAWLDCDVVFEKPDWAPEAKALLDRKCAIQLFSEAGFLDAGCRRGCWKPQCRSSRACHAPVLFGCLRSCEGRGREHGPRSPL